MAVPVFLMLRFLGVRHLAVIDRLEVEFGPGLNVLTGETGAGKSILVNAIDLLVGGRATTDLVRSGESHATIQAAFDAGDGREILVRREVSAEGRSRAFVDDTLVTAGSLKDLGASLLSLHGQHEHRALAEPAEQIEALDGFLDHTEPVNSVAHAFDAWRAAAEALQRSQLNDQEKRARIDRAQFQLQDVEKVAPIEGEDEQLEGVRDVLANADRLSRLSSEAYGALYDSDDAALSRLAIVWKRLGELAAIDSAAAAYVAQREPVKAHLEDLAIFLRDYREKIDAAPDQLQRVEDRLAALDRLKTRYGPTLADVLAKKTAWQQELDELGAGAEKLAALTTRESETRAAFVAAARGLSAVRRDAAVRLSQSLARELRDLAMPSSRIEIRVTFDERVDRATRRGLDVVEFLFSPNPGEDLRPLARVASGGEFSRLMLALRLLTLRGRARSTLIFDEVDAGIGGAAADAVAMRLQALGARYQVLCVTHLAQVAARADAHFEITKSVKAGRTHTTVRRLDHVDREQELARMIAGASVSAAVLASAREMLIGGVRMTSEGNTKDRKGVRRGA